ncbi:MAG: phospholipase A [Salinivirgaceae bacterium]|nr:phospholipase A [Salinivirgaceae bacterium]
MYKKLILFSSILILTGNHLTAQIDEFRNSWQQTVDSTNANFFKAQYLNISKEQLFELFDNLPSFEMFRDNYFTTGVPTNKAIDKNTADIKFQISVIQRLTKSILPLNTSLMLSYTQKSFWNAYENSSPFSDNNYNPGLMLMRPILYNNHLKGIGTLAFEHESNGLDSIKSRSWNYLTVSGVYFFNASFSVQAKLWAGKLGSENMDLYKYKGYGLLAINYRDLRDRFGCSLILNPNSNLSSINTQFELNFRPSKKANQYLFLQWYNGYAEGLLEYNKYSSMLRVGICIKPPIRSLY